MTSVHEAGIFLLVCYLTTVASDNRSILIYCNGPTTPSDTELYGQFETLEASTNLTVNCTHLRPETSFIIFQVHAYRFNVTLFQDEIAPHTSFVGMNLGMYSSSDNMKPFSIANFNGFAVKLYISVHGYNKSDAIPGGCNLVEPVEVDPVLGLWFTNNIIRVVAAPARINRSKKCGDDVLKKLTLYHTFYRLYLNEQDFSEQEYFNGIRNMLTLGNILKFGTQVPTRFLTSSTDQLMKQFSLYPGTGMVFVTVVTTSESQAVYVPSVTYGCRLMDGEDSCSVFSDILSQVVCALMFFAGLFVCYAGHRFFKTEMFLAGLLAGAVITYVVLSHVANLDPTDLVGGALLSGVFSGAIWWLFWWFYGMPVFAVLLPTLLLGFLFSSIVMFFVPDESMSMAVDVTYWSVFWILALLIPLFLVCVTLQANILCCAVIGAYATVYPLDHYIGSNLKYIVTNIVRRAVVPDFENANVAVPYQWRDGVTTTIWVLLAVTGFLFQLYQNKGRVPFPPPPRETIPTIAFGNSYRRLGTDTNPPAPRPRTMSRRLGKNERTPLLA